MHELSSLYLKQKVFDTILTHFCCITYNGDMTIKTAILHYNYLRNACKVFSSIVNTSDLTIEFSRIKIKNI